MKRVTPAQTKRIAELQSSIGDRTLRTLLAGEGKPIMRPERLANLKSGRGRLTESESRQLQKVGGNTQSIKALKARGGGNQDYRSNRAIRQWLVSGKKKGVDIPLEDEDAQEKKRRAVRALRYLGVDPTDGTFYVRE